jgi:DNA-binding MarR family transcriptional regulator
MARIYSEIRQERPFARPGPELAVTLLRTGDVFHHGVDRALAPFEISHEQYNALRILRGAGVQGHPTLEISRRLLSRSPNITRLLDKLIAKGFAHRERGTEDRRQALLRITPAGIALLRRADKAVDAVIAKLRCLTKREMRLLVELLDRVRGAVEVATVWEGLRGERPERPGR